jgi:hypothetical protein
VQGLFDATPQGVEELDEAQGFWYFGYGAIFVVVCAVA